MQGRPSRLKLVLAFGAVYIIWGSTYLAIRYAIETLTPLLMAGTRFILAGTMLYTWARLRGASADAGRINGRAALVIVGLPYSEAMARLWSQSGVCLPALRRC